VFSKILIANRGEIAARVIATCRQMGIGSVAVHSDADAGSLHVRVADEAVALGAGPAAENYLNIAKIIEAARSTGAEAIHPGYGFLSENADFARAVAEAGLVFIGPSAEAISTMGAKIAAREAAVRAEVPLAPGSDGPISTVEEIVDFGELHGYPLLVKASAGGGGRGMRRINSAEEAEQQFSAAVREATAAFGNGEVYLERYLVNARHIEVQVMADAHGNVVYFGDRDCSVQRRHQKLVEEAPAPGLSADLRRRMGESAVRLARLVGYVGAGTVEFLVEGEDFYFLEMNTRIQVEHPVTEMVQGIDLIREQVLVAAGQVLSVTESGRPAHGVALEARINAEDPSGGRFLPTPGPLEVLVAPAGEGLRFDAGYEQGDEVLPYYDSLVGKLIAWGEDRATAIERLHAALGALRIEGVRTTAPAARLVLEQEAFRAVEYNTLWLESSVEFPEDFGDFADDGGDRQEVEVAGRVYWIPVFADRGADGALAGTPAGVGIGGGSVAAASGVGGRGPSKRAGRPGRQAAASDGTVTSPMQGTIIKVNVQPGQAVSAGDVLFVLEAMKMENPITAPHDGVVGGLDVAEGSTIAAGALLTRVDAASVEAGQETEKQAVPA
jgi:acetyl-CoA/propionyl-CoA carboxylase, biotin carboxylase, biotin carboxyl carrier protein